jgi:hypothetical protein
VIFRLTTKFDRERRNAVSAFEWKEKYPGAIFVESLSSIQARRMIQDVQSVKWYDFMEVKMEHYATLFSQIEE